MRRLALVAAVSFGLAGCDGASYGVSVGYPYGYGYGYDYGFRSDLYGVHHDVDIDVNLPDRPLPPGGIGGGDRPSTLPAYAGSRPGGGAGAGRPAGGRPGGGRAPRRMR